jgi:T-complex protein 1 subunit gamma
MLKMMLDPIGGIQMTNDGNAILREVDVKHPAAKSMIELSRAQDESVGDGTTSVVILAGEVLTVCAPFLEKKIHPTVIIRGLTKALEDIVAHYEAVGVPIDSSNRAQMLRVIGATIGTKFAARWGDLMCGLALDAVLCVRETLADGSIDIDTKRYAKVEKVPGGSFAECRVLPGCMINKDVTHAKMRRRIENPRVLILDCPLEYKKGESQTSIEVSNADDWQAVLKEEEKAIQQMCADIIQHKVDIVLTEKGLSDLAQHYFVKANITAFRRMRKTDSNRLARACGATIVHRTDEIKASDIGDRCGLMEVRKLGDEYFAFFEECKEPKACTVLLRGASKDVLNELERNLHDALAVTRAILQNPAGARISPGGGALEMSAAVALSAKAKSISGVEQYAYRAAAAALEVIPRTLAENCGAKAVRVLTELRAKHSTGGAAAAMFGVNGRTGELADMKELGVMESLEVKLQTVKGAIEAAALLLRVDDIVSGIGKKAGQQQQQRGPAAPNMEQMMQGE